ncbi:NAD(P)/FAD-dependent oxidoreductase [Olsenella sp. YH-ols2217]|uniref:NAD(P)/FAD-dependent oxidoreductase n=1 Tax=Kribbibacterium absianum TaxID=3044210 RepID=A0ABT6ZMC3_9ACTN|nr:MULTISPECIES: NAD(P)/FAD-dependent oxidoreductase [unclassified Olsenella]MDJ1122195.1 NAD(P)/FAD-dependent oxidoreductase [Olsenella sp. YH-ols2216]MDJ1130203.1 NAD(P)/FAD-dependent oxidoreductase [Olsenella sp. YH-ols2217]
MAKAGSAKGRRLHAQAVARRAAAAVAVPDRCDVLVVGAGASGCAAALGAAQERPGATVVLLDASDQIARPVLATGNGRCNLSNEDLDPCWYNDPAFVRAVMGPEPEQEVGRLFAGLGLITAHEEGRIYPHSRCASSVQGALVNGLVERSVVLGTLRPVAEVEPLGSGARVTFEERFREAQGGWARRRIDAAAVVLAPGAPTGLPAQLGLPTVPWAPVLCPVAVDSPLPALWDGHRSPCRLTLLRDGAAVAVEEGEALFRPGCVSGIAAMNLSRVAKPGDVLSVDLVPGVPAASLARLIADVDRRLPDERRSHRLDALVDPVIGATLAGRSSDPVDVARELKALDMPVTGLAHTEHAQVQRGGVIVDAVDPVTMAVAGRPGLFMCGEALDVDGACGGYNLAFAWLSGLRAGRAAARFAKGEGRRRDGAMLDQA